MTHIGSLGEEFKEEWFLKDLQFKHKFYKLKWISSEKSIQQI
jgi:hypothetical protein